MSDLPPPPPPARKKHGCFFYGCLTLVILAILAGVATFFAVRYVLHKVTALIEQYTDSSAVALPAVTVSAADYETLKARLTEFQDALNGQAEAPPLTLSAADLNALITQDPSMKEWKDRLRVSLESNQVKGQISLPLDQLGAVPGLGRLKGRFLNGSAVLKASLENGLLDVHLMSIEVKGMKPPDEVMAPLREENLAKDLSSRPDFAANLRKLDSLEVKDGVVTLKAKPPPAAAPPPQ